MPCLRRRAQTLSSVRESGLTARTPDDAQLRELRVVRLDLTACLGSQLTQRHRITTPCLHFCRSENSRADVVLGRMGQELGQYERVSRSHYLFKRATG